MTNDNARITPLVERPFVTVTVRRDDEPSLEIVDDMLEDSCRATSPQKHPICVNPHALSDLV